MIKIHGKSWNNWTWVCRLTLGCEFGKIMDVVGFDINEERINELKKGYDRTREVETEELNVSFETQIFLLS